MSAVSDQAAKESVERLKRQVQLFMQLLKNYEDKMRKDELLNAQLLKIQADINACQQLIGGTEIPKIYAMKNDMQLNAFLKKKIDEYNKTPDGIKTPIILFDNFGNRNIIMANNVGLERLKEFQIQFAVERGGTVTDISTKDFAKYSEGKSVTILKNIDENQYNYIASKAWAYKTNFSFTASRNNNGTYNIAVLSGNYMAHDIKETKEDLFPSLVEAKVCGKDLDAVNKYNVEMKLNILNYNNDDTVYIADAKNRGPYIELNKNEAIVKIPGYREHMQEIHIPKGDIVNESDKQNFMDKLTPYLDDMNDPVYIDKNLISKLESKNNIDINTLLNLHSVNGLDTDFEVYDDEGNLQYARPICDKNDAQLRLEQRFAKNYGKETAKLAVESMTDYYADKFFKAFEKIARENGILASKYEDAIKKDIKETFLAQNAPAMDSLDRKALGVDTITNTLEQLQNSDRGIKAKFDTISDSLYRIDDKKFVMTAKDKEEYIKEANHKLNSSILLKTYDKKETELFKIITEAEASAMNLPIKETADAVDKTAEIVNESLYITEEKDILSKFNINTKDNKDLDIVERASSKNQAGKAIEDKDLTDESLTRI